VMPDLHTSSESLTLLLRTLRLPTFGQRFEDLALVGERQGWSFDHYLYQLAEAEVEERRRRRVDRALKASDLPPEKTLATLELNRFSTKVRRLLPNLCEGDFIHHAENVLAFGLPGRGKTHLVSAIGHELTQRGFRVLFVPAFRIVQQLLAAKRDIKLDATLRKLDRFDVVILDDIGYIQQDRDEMEVLFTFLAERYERRSVMVTSNLVLSEWDKIFKDPMTTACAIERLVHHSVILELGGKSYRTEVAHKRNAGNAACIATTEAAEQDQS
jgi:DNA replication protein DnaC